MPKTDRELIRELAELGQETTKTLRSALRAIQTALDDLNRRIERLERERD